MSDNWIIGRWRVHGANGSAFVRKVCRLIFGLIAGVTGRGSSVTWDPIPAEHRAAQPPASAPDLAAEILYSKIDLVVKDYKATQHNFQRIKVYSERAVEKMGKLGVEYSDSERVSELAARVVHADGREVVLPESQFQEIVLGRWDHGHRMGKRLVVPRLVPGDIVELQWRIDEDGRFKGSRFIYCQEMIPVRKFEFLIRNSYSGPMNIASFGAGKGKLEGSGSRRVKVVITDIPAYVEESDMPPPFNMRASVLLAYGEMPAFEAQIWAQAVFFLRLYEKIQCAVTPALRKDAVGLVANLKFREEQLQKLYEFCQTAIANNAYDESPESRAERVVYHEPRTAQETWKVKRGNPLEINCLFAALANAAGFEAHLAFSANRDEVMNVNFSHGWFFMKTSGVLVKLGGDWQVFAPGDRAVPFGLRRWQREETQTFLLDDDDYIRWVQAETTYKQRAKRTREGKLTVDENGGLSGEITEKLEGQMAIAWREEHWEQGPDLLEEAVRKQVQGLLPQAEVAQVRVDHLNETGEPLIIHYALRLTNYAAITGDHLVMMPGIFQAHTPARYTEPTRVNPIWWKYPWQEEDKFDLTLPKEFEVEAADPLAPISEPNGTINHHASMDVDSAANCLHYHREESVGRAGALSFLPESYQTLKFLFDEIHRAQTQAIVLRRRPAAGAVTQP